MARFAVGGISRERVEVEVIGYERDDGNWLTVRVSVSAGAFAGSYDAAFLADELVSFRDQLESLYRSLQGEAIFSTVEEQLSLSTLAVTGGDRSSLAGALSTKRGPVIALSLRLASIKRM